VGLVDIFFSYHQFSVSALIIEHSLGPIAIAALQFAALAWMLSWGFGNILSANISYRKSA
jgi:hypothetical protein